MIIATSLQLPVNERPDGDFRLRGDRGRRYVSKVAGGLHRRSSKWRISIHSDQGNKISHVSCSQGSSSPPRCSLSVQLSEGMRVSTDPQIVD